MFYEIRAERDISDGGLWFNPETFEIIEVSVVDEFTRLIRKTEIAFNENYIRDGARGLYPHLVDRLINAFWVVEEVEWENRSLPTRAYFLLAAEAVWNSGVGRYREKRWLLTRRGGEEAARKAEEEYETGTLMVTHLREATEELLMELGAQLAEKAVPPFQAPIRRSAKRWSPRSRR